MRASATRVKMEGSRRCEHAAESALGERDMDPSSSRRRELDGGSIRRLRRNEIAGHDLDQHRICQES